MKKSVDIKEKGSEYLKIGWVCALAIAIVAVLFIPECAPNPYKPKVEAGVITIELPPEMKQLAEPPPPPKPKMPVEAETAEEVEQTTIERTDFTGFEKAPPPPSTETPDFVPYDTPPEPVYITKPKYPEIGRKAGVEGIVYLKLLLDTTGYVIDVKVSKSLNPAFDESAASAARTWRFTPAKQRDRPVRVWLGYPVRFTLKD
ncbi:MAG: energy transducer TonB [bacterium (Candidatus Stahlbacteria) CG08_land_8_20_14_0_20_40_26]|nr:MAG: energy transducer TonB [bacterium (Candidatus Stahlbacteria) CG23_combo_of_CG06-09_8_20_14_all_40_9]PIS24846.1 MAG: energy transducer TonB [bacterium (Candidatus Stahlbacteria) CG08_land_8_20_14_0_20_40_26]